MLELLSGMLIGGGAVFTVEATRLRRLSHRRYRPPEALCGCTHHYSVHDDEGCHEGTQVLVERGKPKTLKTGYDGSHHKTVYELERYETRRCPCRRYTGPEPLPELYAP